MKLLFSILTFFFSTPLIAQNTYKLTPTKMRLYTEIKNYPGIQDLGYFEEIGEEREYWKKADSLFKNMPLKEAMSYYHDSSYAIRYYSFLKILGQNDTLAFKQLSRYISDSTKILFQADDIGGEVPFNEFLTRAYEAFIDSKYYWCDTKGTLYRKYFRSKPFIFHKINYAKWPIVLTSFIELITPWNIKHNHDLDDLKYYRGVKYFRGR